MKMVFVAGPLSGISNGKELPQEEQQQHVERACGVGVELLKAGFAPFIPHLSWYIDPYTKYHEWYAIDLEFVRRSDAVLRISGQSRGADIETELAGTLGVPVFHSVEEIIKELGYAS